MTEPSPPKDPYQASTDWFRPPSLQSYIREGELRELTAAVRDLLEELALQRHPFAPTPAELQALLPWEPRLEAFERRRLGLREFRPGGIDWNADRYEMRATVTHTDISTPGRLP